MIISFNEPQPAPVKCSFCGRPKDLCKHLIGSAVNGHHICYLCVAKATERLATVNVEDSEITNT